MARKRSNIAKRNKKHRRRKHRTLNSIELLEARQMLAVEILWDASEGSLTVVGTAESESIQISTTNSIVSVNGVAVVAADGSGDVDASLVQSIEVSGGDGNDVIDLGDVTTSEFSQLSVVTADGDAGDDILVGSEFDDALTGSSGNDVIAGNGGADFIQGGPGDDSIEGGAGNDFLYGDAGADSIDGQGGDDVLLGGLEGDELFGGDGDDYFGGVTSADEIDGGAGVENIEIRDDSSDVQLLGEWNESLAGGFNNQQSFAAAGQGANRVAWNFSELPIDTYDVFVTWGDFSSADPIATNTPIALLGEQSLTATIDQTQLPAGNSLGGKSWYRVGSVAVVDGSLDVEMSDDANGVVIADAIRIVPWGKPGSTVGLSGLETVRTGSTSSNVGATYELAFETQGIPITDWTVNWADGDSSTYSGLASSVSHSYEEPGTYAIQASANVAGEIYELTKEIVVARPVGSNLVVNGIPPDSAVPATDGVYTVASLEGWTTSTNNDIDVVRVTDAGGLSRVLLGLNNTRARDMTQTLDTVPGRSYFASLVQRQTLILG